MAAALATLAGETSARASPIAHALAAAITDLSPKGKEPLQVILISDLMEHTPTVSAYRGTLTEGDLASAIDNEARDALKNAAVSVVQIADQHHAKEQNAATAAWRALFARLGVGTLSFEKL